MAGVSLRVIAVMLSVAYALVMASIALSITVTVTTDSLRRFGKQHANALADVTLTRLESFFELPSARVDVMRNASRLETSTPAFSALQQRLWQDRTTFDMFAVPQSRGANVIFFDGTRVFSSVVIFPSDVHEDRYAQGIQLQREFYSQPGNYTSSWAYVTEYYDDTLKPAPNTSALWRLTPYKVNTAVILSTLASGTFGGRFVLWYYQPLLVVIDQRPILYTIVVSPLHNAQGAVQGFCGPAITLNIMSSFLQQIQETPHSYGFIIDSLGFLLATSCPIPFTNLTTTAAGVAPPLGCQVSGGDVLADANAAASSTQYINCRTAAANYDYAPLRAVMRDTPIATATTQTAVFMTVDGDGYFVVSAPVNVRYPNLALQLVLTMPEVEVVGDLVGARNVAIGVSIGVTAGLSVVIVVLVTFLFAPIARTAIRLRDDDPLAGDRETIAEAPTASLAEVRDVQLAHRAMRTELRRIRAFVPIQAMNSLADGGETPNVEALCHDGVEHHSLNPLAVSPEAAQRHKTTPVGPGPGVAPPDSAAKHHRKVHRKVRFVDDEGASTVRYNAIEVPLLALRDVAVLSANCNGFHRWCVQLREAQRRDTATALALRVRALVQMAHDAIQRHGGVLDRFNGDQVEATFTARSGGGASHVCAVMAGIDLLGMGRNVPTAEGLTIPSMPLRWRAGVGFGSSVVGHGGSATAQSSHIIGAAWTHAVACQELSKVYRVRGVIVSERVFALMQSDAELEWRALGAEQLPGQARKSVVLAVRRRACSTADSVRDRAVDLRNAVLFLRGDNEIIKAASVEEALRHHLRDHQPMLSLEAWEFRLYMQWTDIPSFESRFETTTEQHVESTVEKGGIGHQEEEESLWSTSTVRQIRRVVFW